MVGRRRLRLGLVKLGVGEVAVGAGVCLMECGRRQEQAGEGRKGHGRRDQLGDAD
jgi:hypothetical protein